MTTLPITSLTAVVLTVLLIVLSARVIRVRRGQKISVGDGGDALFARRVRAHGNLVEYAPFGILLCLLAELQGAAFWPLVAGATTLVAGRILHAIGMTVPSQNQRSRPLGMVLTFVGLAVLAALTLWQGLA